MLSLGGLHQRNVCDEEKFGKLADLKDRKKSNAKRKKTITSGNKLKSKDQMLDIKAEIALRLMVQLIPVPD